jgi:hypothetical protein
VREIFSGLAYGKAGIVLRIGLVTTPIVSDCRNNAFWRISARQGTFGIGPIELGLRKIAWPQLTPAGCSKCTLGCRSAAILVRKPWESIGRVNCGGGLLRC